MSRFARKDPFLPVDYAEGWDSPQKRENRKEHERQAQARAQLAAGRMQRQVDATRERELLAAREEKAAREYLKARARVLAQEIERERDRGRPNPWIGPDSPEYVSPVEHAVLRELSGEAADSDARVQRMVRRLGELNARAQIAEDEWQVQARNRRQIR